MLSHIIGIIFVVIGILMMTYVVLDETKLNNNQEDFNIILWDKILNARFVMTKIDIISGFLGAGKTTLIKKLINEN